jgi:hypothetical protein
MKKVRISNTTGLQEDTRIQDADTGEELPGIIGIDILPMQVRTIPLKVEITVSPHSLDLIAYATFYTLCPHCGKAIQGIAKENEKKE